MTVIILILAMSLPAVFVLIAAVPFVLWPGPAPAGEGRADWRGPFGHLADGPRIQRTAASMATAANSSAR